MFNYFDVYKCIFAKMKETKLKSKLLILKKDEISEKYILYRGGEIIEFDQDFIITFINDSLRFEYLDEISENVYKMSYKFYSGCL